MIPIRRWLPVVLAVLLAVCLCHCGRKPGASPQAPKTFTVMIHGEPDSGALCRAAEAVQESLVGKDFVKSLRVTGYAEDEIVIEADPDMLNKMGVDFSALPVALRQGLPDVPEDAVAADEEKKTVVITVRECRKLDLDADQIMTITVEDPQGNFIPLGHLVRLKVRPKSQGFFHKGGRALRVEVALADDANHEEAKESLERVLAGHGNADLVSLDVH